MSQINDSDNQNNNLNDQNTPVINTTDTNSSQVDTKSNTAATEVFTFGSPESVLDRRGLLDYLECTHNGKWYEPPISIKSLTKLFNATVHHSSPLIAKRNILFMTFIPHPLLSRSEFSKFALNYLVTGNGYLELRRNRFNQPLKLLSSPAKYTRRGIESGVYWFTEKWNNPYLFEPDSIFHLMQHSLEQEIYGEPEYLAAINSILCNESATLFRRRYYENGSHAGYILYMTDAAQKQEDIDNLRAALKKTRGLGNFKNLFMYAPNGKKDGIQLIPISEVAAKDEFLNIKNATRDDQLAMHRVPPQLMGIMPNNTGGFGDIEKAAKVFATNEVGPIQEAMKEVNDWLGIEVIRFKEYSLLD